MEIKSDSGILKGPVFQKSTFISGFNFLETAPLSGQKRSRFLEFPAAGNPEMVAKVGDTVPGLFP